MATDNIQTAHNNLRNSIVDLLSTKNNNMKQRRVINAAPAVNSNDYVIKSQVDQSTGDLQSQIDTLNGRQIPISNSALYAQATANLTLTTTYQIVPGATVNVTRIGTYFVSGIFFVTLTSADAGFGIYGSLNNTGAIAVLAYGPGNITNALYITIAQNWVVPVFGPTTFNLMASKTGGSGTSFINASQTTISAILIN